MKKKIQLENINLVRKIAWSFKKTTKESFDDLFQEGFMGLMRAMETYNPKKGSFSTHAWYCINSDIKDYLRDMKRKTALIEAADEVVMMGVEIPNTDFFETLPEESLEIAKVVLSAPRNFVVRDPEEVKERIINIMANEGWSMDKIFFGINQLSKACLV